MKCILYLLLKLTSILNELIIITMMMMVVFKFISIRYDVYQVIVKIQKYFIQVKVFVTILMIWQFLLIILFCTATEFGRCSLTLINS